MLYTEPVYLGTDNVIAISLSRETKDITHIDDSSADTVVNKHTHPTVTRCKLRVKKIIDDPADTDLTIDSNTNPSWFDLASDPEIMKMKLGAASIKPGRHVAEMTVYEASTPLGVLWGSLVLVVA